MATTTAASPVLELVGRGVEVFPVHGVRGDGTCDCGQGDCSIGKHPITRDGLRGASRDPKKVESWWSSYPEANVGVPTGEVNGFFVLDVDPRHGGLESLAELEDEHSALPETPKVRTGSGGLHYYFAYPEGGVRNSAGRLGKGLDIRGDGGYVLAPPSNHASGGSYQWEVDLSAPLADAPYWLLELVRAGGVRDYSAGEPVAEGERETVLTSQAGAMRRRGMSQEAILAALAVENAERCKPPLTEADVERIAASVSRYAPAEVPLRGLVVDPRGESGTSNNGALAEQALADELKETGALTLGGITVVKVDGGSKIALLELSTTDGPLLLKAGYEDDSHALRMSKDYGELRTLLRLLRAVRLAMAEEGTRDSDLRPGALVSSTAIPPEDPTATPFLWGDFIPGDPGVVLFVGETSTGKTSLLFQLARHLARGEDYLGRPAQRNLKVVHVDVETPPNRRRYILDTTGGRHVDWVFYEPLEPLSSLTEQARLLQVCRGFGADRVVVDTLLDVWPVNDENDNAQANYQMQALRQLARAGGFVVLATMHTGKLQEDQKFARGATARTDRADQVLFFKRDEADGTLELRVGKSRFGMQGKSVCLRFTGDLDFAVVDRQQFMGLSGAEAKVAGYIRDEVQPGTEFTVKSELVPWLSQAGIGVSEEIVKRTIRKLIGPLLVLKSEQQGNKPAVYTRRDVPKDVTISVVRGGQ